MRHPLDRLRDLPQSLLSVSLTAVALALATEPTLGSGAPCTQRTQGPAQGDAELRAPFQFTGRVLTSEGRPAGHVTVVSSAGGMALTDERGAFRLEVGLSVDVERVELTATDPRDPGRTITVRVPVLSGSGVVHAGRLELARSPCPMGWLPAFGAQPGITYTFGGAQASAMAVFDDGQGAALYVGGWFDYVGGIAVQGLAKWDGETWSAVGGGIAGTVLAMQEFDDGNGRALYVAGDFGSAGQVSAKNIAKWDGSRWSSLGPGLNRRVSALTSYESEAGPRLIAGGDFWMSGASSAARVAAWDGTEWSAMGTGMDDTVRSLAVVESGGRGVLYAGGDFVTAGGSAAARVAQWDGAAWSPVGSGADAPVHAMASHDDGTGPALYAVGQFKAMGGLTCRIATWDGSEWSAISSGIGRFDPLYSLASLDDGTGRALFVGGNFQVPSTRSRGIARLRGDSWQPLGRGIFPSTVGLEAGPLCLAVYDSGHGPEVFAGGNFPWAGDEDSPDTLNLARWDGARWSGTERGLNGSVSALGSFDDGDGARLVASGAFTGTAEAKMSRIGTWGRAGWSALGSGIVSPAEAVVQFDDGSGPSLYVSGATAAGSVTSRYLSKWNGAAWSDVGGVEPDFTVNSLLIHDDGTGRALYVGGAFQRVGSLPATGLARWDGVRWSDLGLEPSVVTALAEHDAGAGQALFVGGFLSMDGNPERVSMWDGQVWEGLGFGALGTIRAMTSFDDGTGVQLYVAGAFTTAGGVAARNIAKWDGIRWSAVGAGANNQVNALATHDDGSGLALYVGGDFTAVGGLAARHLARWDGRTWAGLGVGLNQGVRTILPLEEDRGPSLYIGGHFDASPARDSGLAKWGCLPRTAPDTPPAEPADV